MFAQQDFPHVPPSLVPRGAPHLSLQLLADGGILAEVTVQADHVAFQLGEKAGSKPSPLLASPRLMPLTRPRLAIEVRETAGRQQLGPEHS